MSGAAHRLVLVRHGSSDWNMSNRFTGWTDVPLTDKGVEQATRAGLRLVEAGIAFDELHTSVLYRTYQTADSLLTAAQHKTIPHYAHWRLNERHYGQLQGLQKQDIFATWGEQNALHWWRGYFAVPPPLDWNDPRHPRFDPRYKELDPALLPSSESLANCQQRVLPYWHDMLLPSLLANRSALVVSHGNTIRSLLMHLENISPDEITKMEIAPGVPLVLQFNKAMKMVGREWLE